MSFQGSRKKKITILILLSCFITASFFLIRPGTYTVKDGVHASQLKTVVIRKGNTKRTDYVDENGKLTNAVNLGYATILETRKDTCLLEQFYDEQGDAVKRYSGEYAMLREYDEQGNIIRNTSLGAQGELILNTSGYAVEERQYNDKGQAVQFRYYDTDKQPVCTFAACYGGSNQYDEKGRISSTTFIDDTGHAMITGLGYATIKYSYYESEGPENGKVKTEFYFDTEGKPVKLSLGQSGLHKGYDEYGRETVHTYLDEDGHPIVTNKGYTTIVRTYSQANRTLTEQYYDMEGNPVAVADGQYGIKRIKGRTMYLDERGEEQFNLRTFLYNLNRLIVIMGMILVLLSSLFNRRLNILFLIVYLGIIAYLTLILRENDGAEVRFQLFWSYRLFFTDSQTRIEILKNIWLFVPLGTILYRLYPKRIILLIPFVLSIMIEAAQYLTGTGFCELDDIISNSLGGFIGYEAGKLLREVIDSIMNRRRKHAQSGSQEREEA